MPTIHVTFCSCLPASQACSIHLRIPQWRATESLILPSKVYSDEWKEDKERGSNYRLTTKTTNLSDFVKTLTEGLLSQNKVRTARAYCSAVKRLTRFCGTTAIPLTHITAALLSAFEQSLFHDGLTRNTTSSYMRSLSAIYHRAVDQQLINAQTVNPFKNVFTGVEATRKRALNRVEINRLTKVDLHNNERLFFSLQLFLFGFHAKGMSFVDMAYLRKSDLRKDTIRYRRRKTRGVIGLKVTPALQEIIDYFAPLTKDSPYLLPIISAPGKDTRLQYESALRLQNKRLNALGKLAGLPSPLSTHVCRHTWASLAKQLNAPLAVISDSLGHSDQRTTQIYLASIGQDVLDRVSDRVSLLVQSPPPLVGRATGYCRL